MELNLISEFKAHPKHAQAVMFSHDGRELATTGMDALAQVWSVPDFGHLRSLHGHEKSVNAIALSPDGSTAVTGSTDRAVMVWDWKSGECAPARSPATATPSRQSSLLPRTES